MGGLRTGRSRHRRVVPRARGEPVRALGSRPRPLPPLYAALANVPKGIVAEYPLLETNDDVIWQTVYRRPMFGNADFGTRADDARRVVLNPRVPGTAESLASLGVTAIITHPDALRYVDDAKDVPNASWGPGYELVTRTPDGSSLWRVVAAAAPALVTLPGGFGEPITDTDSFVGYPLVSPSGSGPSTSPPRHRRPFGSGSMPRHPGASSCFGWPTRTPSFRSSLDGTTSIDVLVDVPRGLSFLYVKTDPAATSVEDAVVLSKPRAVRAFGTPALVAQTLSTEPGL